MKEKMNFIKDFCATFKEALIVFVFILFLLFPEGIKNIFSRLGVTQLNVAGITATIKQQQEGTIKIGQDADSLRRQITQLTDSIKTIASRVSDSEDKKLLTGISQKANNLVALSNSLNNNVINQISQQQNLAAKALNTTEEQVGWIFAGKVDETKKNWITSSHHTIKELKPEYNYGDQVTVIDNVYVRDGDANGTNHANGSIISVAKTGDMLTYLEEDFSHAAGGGWFVWMKVKKTIN